MRRFALHSLLFVVLFSVFSCIGTAPWWAPGPFWFSSACVFVTVVLSGYARMKRVWVIEHEGKNLLQCGRYLEAIATLERGYRVDPENTALMFWSSVARLSLWRLSEAVTGLEQVQEATLSGRKRYAPPEIALTRALLGQAQLAQQWLEKAKAQHDEGVPEALLASAVLACRAQSWPEARALLSRRELRGLGGRTRALGDALRAWTAHRLDGVRAPIDRFALFGDTGPQELHQAWPELIDFLDDTPAF